MGIERENRFYMEAKNVEAEAPQVTPYDVYVFESESMAMFLNNSSNFEKVRMYRYILDRATEFEKIGTRDALNKMKMYLTAAMELEQTEAIQMYHNGEITQ